MEQYKFMLMIMKDLKSNSICFDEKPVEGEFKKSPRYINRRLELT